MKKRIIRDTTNFIAIGYGDIIEIEGKHYIIKGEESERRFGMDDPKHWVKRAVDSQTGEKKILKLSYFESFDTYLSGVKIKRFRNPDKEGAVLKLAKNHPHLMQGVACHDIEGNNVRILDIVSGQDLYVYIDSLSIDHASYFRNLLPGILKRLVKAFEAIRFLHVNGFKHGDIRNDHLIIERDTGKYVWIDFDYDYEIEENPFGLDIFGLGKILVYVVGKGTHMYYDIKRDTSFYGDLVDRIETEDFSILDKGRLINLRKLYPYVPVMLNNILMHFSRGASVYYEFVEELIEDLNRCLYSMLET